MTSVTMRWQRAELLAPPQVQVLPELFLGTSQLAFELPKLSLLPLTLAGRQNRRVLQEVVFQRPDLLLLSKDLAVSRCEFTFDTGTRLRRLRGLIEHYGDVDETDLEIRGTRRKSMSQHESQKTDKARDSQEIAMCIHD